MIVSAMKGILEMQKDLEQILECRKKKRVLGEKYI
jgi:hypothetical protein